ncbi:hypothetical protein [Arthrobacter alpinus]|uniref:hypothetical protein n=1 Tax=Arthrobacter alpinus TaxID=656366 RepID=UPI000B1F0F4E|nr:hypothetical protein [Arthrobacter alpinus]
MAGIQLTIFSSDGASSSANGTVTDPANLAAARIVIDHITDNATGKATDSPEVAK